MIDFDQLSVRDIKDMRDVVGHEPVNRMLDGDMDGLGKSETAELMAALHWVATRKIDTDWTYDNSLEMPLVALTTALDSAGASADPK